MKAYIFLLPILYVYFWVSLGEYLSSHTNFLREIKAEFSLMFVIALVMVLNGINYIIKYNVNTTRINTSYIEDHKYFKDFHSDNGVLYPLFKDKLPYTLPAILPGTWFSNAWNDPSISDKTYLKSLGNRKIYLVDIKDCVGDYLLKSSVIKEGNIFIIFESKISVADLIDNDKFNFDSLKIKNFRSKKCDDL
jgi:hypothetical protein